ncbi:Gfo/Idh/MocA family protein [Paenibacillus puerhi]|uniref:Gfo/Idh/MocA family protein n=1 Tax=Paenibacillus puerhi TaxID=2692622 RepID=UPI00135A7367|nr:Gfo/Idh/MocA family oxidoreductase [Paenibacillus puerhi]
MKLHRFGVVGLGMIADFHIQAIEALPNARLASVCSRNQEKVASLAQAYSCSGTTRYEELLADPEVEIVCVTTGSGSHFAIGREALLAGKHVLLEKPMAMTSAEAAELTQLAKERGLKLGVISQRRFEPQHQAVHRAIALGVLGKLLLLEVRCPFYRTQAYYDAADWRGTLLEDGGALMNQGIHSIDLMLWLAGPARSVMGMTATQTHRMEAEDLGLALVKFASGAYGTIMSSTSIQPGYPPTLRLYGERGSIHLEGASIAEWHVPGLPEPDPEQAEAGTGAGVSNPSHIPSRFHKLQLAQFLEALEKGGEPAVTGEDGQRAVALIEGIVRSAAESREIQL